MPIPKGHTTRYILGLSRSAHVFNGDNEMKTLADYEYYRTDLGVLYNADCLEILPLIPDNSVDLVLTSPPYNLGNNHHTGNIKHTPYDDDMPENEYQNKHHNAYYIDHDLLNAFE